MTFIKHLISLFETNTNPEFAFQMKTYLKDKFELYGIKMGPRRDLLKQAVNNNKDEVKANIRDIVHQLYDSKYREMHHCGAELFEKELRKTYQKEDIKHIEFLITTNSWWDTVDFIAKQILGKYLLAYPQEIDSVINRFSSSENMWLNRSALLFQLGYKEKTNEELFFKLCLKHNHSEEFFIQKAIGWALREYGKTNPNAVIKFVKTADLKPLSSKEAIRNIT